MVLSYLKYCKLLYSPLGKEVLLLGKVHRRATRYELALR